MNDETPKPSQNDLNTTPELKHPMRAGIMGEHINTEINRGKEYQNSTDEYTKEVDRRSRSIVQEAIDLLREGIIDEKEVVDFISGHLTKREIEGMTDYMTGVLNKFGIRGRLREALALASRRNGRVMVAYLDQRRFKKVNDRFGHNVGDLVIKYGIDYLREMLTIREGDLIGRDGGDEVILVFPIYETTNLWNQETTFSQLAPGMPIQSPRLPEQAVEDSLSQHLSGDTYTEYVRGKLKEENERRKRENEEPLNLSDEDIAEIAVSFRYGTAVSNPNDTAVSLIARADQAMTEKKKLEPPEDQR